MTHKVPDRPAAYERSDAVQWPNDRATGRGASPGPAFAAYVCWEDHQRVERHLSLVPQFDGAEAVCGQRIAVNRAVAWVAAVRLVTCADCRQVSSMFRPHAHAAPRGHAHWRRAQ